MASRDATKVLVSLDHVKDNRANMPRNNLDGGEQLLGKNLFDLLRAFA